MLKVTALAEICHSFLFEGWEKMPHADLLLRYSRTGAPLLPEDISWNAILDLLSRSDSLIESSSSVIKFGSIGVCCNLPLMSK